MSHDMNHTKRVRRMARPVRDFLAGLALFTVVAGTGVVDQAPVGAGWIATAAQAGRLETQTVDPSLEPFLVEAPAVQAGGSQGTGAQFRASERQQQVLILISLALAFATVFALNLWFARHVRRARATYRRRS